MTATTTLTEKQKYFLLLGEVCEMLNPGAVEKAVRDEYPATLAALANARIGRNVNLPILVALVQYGLPDYQIPTHLRPAA